MTLKGKYKNAKVFFRVFPTEKMKWNNVKVSTDNQMIYCRCLQDFESGYENRTPRYWNFETDGVFFNNKQGEIYCTVMDQVIESVLMGVDAIVMAYGQTGSGKSLTIAGLYNSLQDIGIAPRAIVDLMLRTKDIKEKDVKQRIEMSCIETRGGYFVDLLNPKAKFLDINSIKVITSQRIKSEKEALKLLYLAEGRRQIAAKSPYESHKANGVVTIKIIKKQMNYSNPVTTISKLHIIDLAGADTCGNLSCFYKNAPDVGIGNLAKTQLEQFLLILCENIPQQILVKQRLNPLILYLNDSLHVHSILRFVGHIRIDKDNLMLTLSMLRFGQIVKGLPESEMLTHVAENKEAKLEFLEEEFKKIEKEKQIQSVLANIDLSSNITAERLQHMQNVATEYLTNKTNEIVLANVTDVTTVLKVFKNLFNQVEARKQAELKKIYEQAYTDALAKCYEDVKAAGSIGSVKGSKTSRRGSNNSSRRSVAKSTTPRNSLKPTDRPGSIAENVQKQTSSQLQQQISSSKATQRSNSSYNKNLSSGKVKSSSSTGRRSKESVPEEKTEPSVSIDIPSRDVAWDMFTNDTSFSYNTIQENIVTYENNIKMANEVYMQEVRKIRSLQELMEKRTNDLLQAEMQRKFEGKDEQTEIENLLFTYLEDVKRKTIEQQEVVLKHQTDLKIMMEMHQNEKQSLRDEFDKYCLQKYGTLLADANMTIILKEQLVTPTPSEEFRSVVQNKETDQMLKSAQYNILQKHEEFKQIMIAEMKKRQKEKERKRKWIQPYKPINK